MPNYLPQYFPRGYSDEHYLPFRYFQVAAGVDATVYISGILVHAFLHYPEISKPTDAQQGGGAYYQPILSLFKEFQGTRADATVDVDGVVALSKLGYVNVHAEVNDNPQEILEIMLAINDAIDAGVLHVPQYNEEIEIIKLIDEIASLDSRKTSLNEDEDAQAIAFILSLI